MRAADLVISALSKCFFTGGAAENRAASVGNAPTSASRDRSARRLRQHLRRHGGGAAAGGPTRTMSRAGSRNDDGGMAGVAGTVLAIMNHKQATCPARGPPDRRVRNHVPAALMLSEGWSGKTGQTGIGRGRRSDRDHDPPRSSMDAIAQGTGGRAVLANVAPC